MPAEPRDKPPYYYIPDGVAQAAEARLIVAGQMYREFKRHGQMSKVIEEASAMLKETDKKNTKLPLPDTASQPVETDNESQNAEEGESQLVFTL